MQIRLDVFAEDPDEAIPDVFAITLTPEVADELLRRMNVVLALRGVESRRQATVVHVGYDVGGNPAYGAFYDAPIQDDGAITIDGDPRGTENDLMCVASDMINWVAIDCSTDLEIHTSGLERTTIEKFLTKFLTGQAT